MTPSPPPASTRYRAAAPDAWGFGWLAETLAVLLLTELEARPRPILARRRRPGRRPAARGRARSSATPAAAPATRRRLFSPELIDWWARWEALDPALRAMAFAMPVEWLLALWEAATPPEVDAAPAPSTPAPRHRRVLTPVTRHQEDAP